MDPLTLAVVGGLIAGVGGAVIIALARRTPAVMKLLRRYFTGLRFLVIGHQGAGKTSFYNYLRHDALTDEYPTLSTHRVSEPLSFSTDKGGDLQLEIKQAVDIPGELEPHVQAEVARDRSPEALLIFVSATDGIALDWLDRTLRHLGRHLATDEKCAKRLRSLTVVINKRDAVLASEVARVEGEVRRIVEARLSGALGNRVHLVDVRACTLIRSAGGEQAADAVILAVLTALRNNRRLTPL